MNSISVIIPMFNSECFLSDLFNCLEQCDFKDCDEVIIVDNGSTDNSYNLCKQLMANNKLYKLISYCDKADSYASRNYGVNIATGDILAFTDSDCKPTPEWLEEVRKLKPGNVLAGDVQLEVIKNSVWELFDSVAHLSQCEKNAQQNCVATANMSVFKKDFEVVGQFEERFSGGDFEWSKRAAKNGLKILFNPKALIIHPSRKTFYEIKKREERVAYGRGLHHKKNNGNYFVLLISYFLRIFKISTQINYSKEMKKRGLNFKGILKFNIGFLIIRFKYIIYASRGFKEINPRNFGIK